jgi:fructose-bisphosphate aldolase class I
LFQRKTTSLKSPEGADIWGYRARTRNASYRNDVLAHNVFVEPRSLCVQLPSILERANTVFLERNMPFRYNGKFLDFETGRRSSPHPTLLENKKHFMTTSSIKEQQQRKIKTQPGFIAALDQSGGSTPQALRAYGIKEGAWSNEEEMFTLVHQMRARIMTSPIFNGDRILGAILFEGTMDRDIEGQPSADYLWNIKRVVPFLKVDKGLADEKDGVQLMKPIPQLAALLDKANAKRIFGTKERSFIKQANAAGIKAIVDQQFELAAQILAAGLVPIIEPEVDIHCPEKAKAETLLKAGLLERLNELPAGQLVMLKITLPEEDDFYADCVKHPNVLKVVALSGGYSLKEGNDRLRRNHGVIASFSRALLDGLLLQQSDEEYNAVLDATIQSIYETSNT